MDRSNKQEKAVTMTTRPKKSFEVWHQDNETRDLWHAETGLMVNTAALKEREVYFDIVRIPSASFIPLSDLISTSNTPCH